MNDTVSIPSPWFLAAVLLACAPGCSGSDSDDDSSQTTGTGGATEGYVASQDPETPGTGGASANTSSTVSDDAILVGRPCETNTDCDSSMVCYSDSSTYIAYHQCTAYCDDSETCEAQFGVNSFCIGANICVLACRSDADCTTTTRCNDAGWCERTTGVPRCTGSILPCSTLSETDCYSALGCDVESECAGVADSCYSQFSSYSCMTISGCYWSSSSDSCSGVASSCSSQYSEYSCVDQGCQWSGGCSGTRSVDSCDELSPALCKFEPGCMLSGEQ